MMVITDVQIRDFVAENKLLPPNFIPSLRTRNNGNLHYETKVIGEKGNNFMIKIRQARINPFDFSIIFGIVLGNGFFRIKRYNGNSHKHTNKLEKQKIDGFHIHTATERYQIAGFQEDGFAEKSTKYRDWQSALRLMEIENNFKPNVQKDQRRLMVV